MKDYKKYLSEVSVALDDLWDYWMNDAINPADGQFYGEIDALGNKKADANKCIIMYSRIMWSFSAAYNHYKDSKYLNYANIAYDFLKSKFYDSINGGYYWDTLADGTPNTRKKQTYGQSFVLYAFSEYLIATGDSKIKQEAKELFDLIEKKCYDPQLGGYFEAFAEDWTRLDDVRLSLKDANEQKSMNTNLHVMEAYTRYFEATNNEIVGEALKKLVVDFNKYIVGKDYHLILFFDEMWNVRSNIISYGHDIEASWLLWEAAHVTNDKELVNLIKPQILKVADLFLKEGLRNNEGVYYEYFPDNKHLDTDHHWWPQVEAIEGLSNAFKITGDEKYINPVFSIWDFTFKNFPNKQSGEWHWLVTADGKTDDTKIKTGAWKTPYHSSRAMMKFREFLMKNISA